MARLPRVVVPGFPHHVTQRGNRRQQTFFGEEDYAEYRRLVAVGCRGCGTRVWAYCLMPNHVHLVLVPADEFGLRAAMAEAHRQYTRMINFRAGWRGHLWQERFHSFVMDERHLVAAAKYIERNPVRARLCVHPQDWPWSSARAHLAGADDELVCVRPLLDLIPGWESFVCEADAPGFGERLHLHAGTGRPLGSPAFVKSLESRIGRPLIPRKSGPKPKRRDGETLDLFGAPDGH